MKACILYFHFLFSQMFNDAYLKVVSVLVKVNVHLKLSKNQRSGSHSRVEGLQDEPTGGLLHHFVAKNGSQSSIQIRHPNVKRSLVSENRHKMVQGYVQKLFKIEMYTENILKIERRINMPNFN